MNKTTSLEKTQPSHRSVASLGTAQIALEAATKELLAAQAAYLKAAERLTVAEEAHVATTTALLNEMNTVRDKCKVPNLTLRG